MSSAVLLTRDEIGAIFHNATKYFDSFYIEATKGHDPQFVQLIGALVLLVLFLLLLLLNRRCRKTASNASTASPLDNSENENGNRKGGKKETGKRKRRKSPLNRLMGFLWAWRRPLRYFLPSLGLLWISLFPLACISTGEAKCRGTYFLKMRCRRAGRVFPLAKLKSHKHSLSIKSSGPFRSPMDSD